MMNKKTILVAEDNDSNYMYLWLLLRNDYNVLWAHNGREAVEMVQANSVDLILMDIKMPEMTGLQATEIIRKSYPALPIVIQSSYAFDLDIDEAKKKGATGYLTKPILRERLMDELRKYGL